MDLNLYFKNKKFSEQDKFSFNLKTPNSEKDISATKINENNYNVKIVDKNENLVKVQEGVYEGNIANFLKEQIGEQFYDQDNFKKLLKGQKKENCDQLKTILNELENTSDTSKDEFYTNPNIVLTREEFDDNNKSLSDKEEELEKSDKVSIHNLIPQLNHFMSL